MKRVRLALGAAVALTSAWAIAQEGPESLLPPGFDRPAPKARPAAAPAAATPAAQPSTAPVITPLAVVPTVAPAASPEGAITLPEKLPSLAELEAMSPEELDELLGLKPTTDIPPSARRAMTQVGIIDQYEGGLPPHMLARQNASLVKAVIAGNKGTLVSRWGHILLRRALASRLDAPAGMNPADFAALRAALLVRMGEGDAARALVQDIDGGNYTPGLTQAALDAYIATADITGSCPIVTFQGSVRKDPQWRVLTSICSAFQGQGTSAMTQLDRMTGGNVMPRIDMLLAQKYAGAAGKARRAVKIEWDGVEAMTPWRYALSIATGVEPPAALMRDAGERYALISATAPMLGLPARAAAADQAAGRGVLSSQAMVDLYSQIYAQDDITGEWATRAETLRDAYVGETPAARIKAMRQLWDEAPGPLERRSRLALTAYAAARVAPSTDHADDAGDLIAAMLSAGLDRNALLWSNVVESGTPGWALLACAAPTRSTPIDAGALGAFHDDDDSDGARKSAFLLAGLAGLGRITPDTRREFAEKLGVDLSRQTRWTRLIDQAAQVDNAALVALLAGVGMQGAGWDKMTPLHLFHIVSALDKVGLSAEARMIAAEAVAQG